jgi:hypothetical protein
LRSAAGLRRGWSFAAKTALQLVEALEAIYPGTVDALCSPDAVVRSADWVLERQTGRYEKLREVDDAWWAKTTAALCGGRCVRRRLWDPTDQQSFDRPPCPRPCNSLLDALLMARSPG